MLRDVSLLLLALFATPLLQAADSSLPVGQILKNVSETYSKLTAYELEAEVASSMTAGAARQSVEQKVRLAAAANGRYRLELDSNGESELRLSDGTSTWKALPHSKIWSVQQSASAVSDANSDGDADGEPASAQDLFHVEQDFLVRRFQNLRPYIESAWLMKTASVKFGGEKTSCYVIRINMKKATLDLYVAENSFLVLKSITRQGASVNTTETVSQMRSLNTAAPAASRFMYQPAGNFKQVADLQLPSERGMSLVGQAVRDFELTTLTGKSIHLADLRGHIVMLDFWASWCPPCRHELPVVESLGKKFKNRNVIVLGVNDEDPSTARRFLEKNHPDLETLSDPKRKVHRAYNCSSIPTVLVINPEGRIVAHMVGSRESEELVAALKQGGLN